MKTIASLAPLTALLLAVSFGSYAPMAWADDAQATNPATANSATATKSDAAPSERKTIHAQCFERTQLLLDLANDQGERLNQTKRVGDKGLLEAFTSPTDGTWTIVYSDSDQRSCIIASGDGLPVAQDDSAEDARVPKKVEAHI
ncbi:MAG TPA: hypothetical protein VGO34_12895 [Alphaproteobacteria bacterium]|jgi:hypothetical protein